MLSVGSVAVSLFLLVTLLTLIREFTVPPEDVGASLRLVVRNKVSLAQPLPSRQLPVLDKIPGVIAVTPFTFFGGKFRDESFTSFAQFAVDPPRFTNLFVESRSPPKEIDAWIHDRTSCLVGMATMKRYGLNVGDRMKLTGTFYPCDLDLKIVATYEGSMDDRNVFFHHKYLDELTGNPGTIGTWWLRVASAGDAPRVIAQVNRAFENTSAEVRAETERAFQMSFVSMWGNIKVLVGSICTVVVFTLMLVTISTMSMAIRERFRELAILKALGFRRREIFSFILAESFGLAAAGGLVGIGGAWCFWHFINIQELTNGFLVYFEVTPRTMARAAVVATVLGVVSAIGPSLAVARTSVVQGLKTLD
jgi:putative ABC transport system permease protein